MKIRVELSKSQRGELEDLMRKTKSRVEAQRCRIIRLLAQGDSPRDTRRLDPQGPGPGRHVQGLLEQVEHPIERRQAVLQGGGAGRQRG